MDARALFPKNSLADLYDPLTMPPELLKAQRELDKAATKIFDYAKDMPESAIVTAPMGRYQSLIEGES